MSATGFSSRVAGRLQRCIRACDTVARLGGDEFGVILARLDHERGARVAAERILESLVEPLTPGTGAPLVGASIGISFYPEHGDDADTLLKKADTAMYHVKANGKNHSRFFRGIRATPGRGSLSFFSRLAENSGGLFPRRKSLDRL